MGAAPSKETISLFSYFRGSYEVGLIPLTSHFFGSDAEDGIDGGTVRGLAEAALRRPPQQSHGTATAGDAGPSSFAGDAPVAGGVPDTDWRQQLGLNGSALLLGSLMNIGGQPPFLQTPSSAMATAASPVSGIAEGHNMQPGVANDPCTLHGANAHGLTRLSQESPLFYKRPNRKLLRRQLLLMRNDPAVLYSNAREKDNVERSIQRLLADLRKRECEQAKVTKAAAAAARDAEDVDDGVSSVEDTPADKMARTDAKKNDKVNDNGHNNETSEDGDERDGDVLHEITEEIYEQYYWQVMPEPDFTEADLDHFLTLVDEALYESDADMVYDARYLNTETQECFTPLPGLSSLTTPSAGPAPSPPHQQHQQQKDGVAAPGSARRPRAFMPIPCALCLAYAEGKERAGCFGLDGRNINIIGYFGCMTAEMQRAFRVVKRAANVEPASADGPKATASESAGSPASTVATTTNTSTTAVGASTEGTLERRAEKKTATLTPSTTALPAPVDLFLNTAILTSAGDRTLERVLVLAAVMLRHQFHTACRRVIVNNNRERIIQRHMQHHLADSSGGHGEVSGLFLASAQQSSLSDTLGFARNGNSNSNVVLHPPSQGISGLPGAAGMHSSVGAGRPGSERSPGKSALAFRFGSQMGLDLGFAGGSLPNPPLSGPPSLPFQAGSTQQQQQLTQVPVQQQHQGNTIMETSTTSGTTLGGGCGGGVGSAASHHSSIYNAPQSVSAGAHAGSVGSVGEQSGRATSMGSGAMGNGSAPAVNAPILAPPPLPLAVAATGGAGGAWSDPLLAVPLPPLPVGAFNAYTPPTPSATPPDSSIDVNDYNNSGGRLPPVPPILTATAATAAGMAPGAHYRSPNLMSGHNGGMSCGPSGGPVTPQPLPLSTAEEDAISRVFSTRLGCLRLTVESASNNYSSLKSMTENFAFLHCQVDLNPEDGVMELIALPSLDGSARSSSTSSDSGSDGDGCAEVYDHGESDDNVAAGRMMRVDADASPKPPRSPRESDRRATILAPSSGVLLTLNPTYFTQATLWASCLFHFPTRLPGGHWVQYKLKDECEQLRQVLQTKDTLIAHWRHRDADRAARYLGPHTARLLAHVQALQAETERVRRRPASYWEGMPVYVNQDARRYTLHRSRYGVMLIGVRAQQQGQQGGGGSGSRMVTVGGGSTAAMAAASTISHPAAAAVATAENISAIGGKSSVCAESEQRVGAAGDAAEHEAWHRAAAAGGRGDGLVRPGLGTYMGSPMQTPVTRRVGGVGVGVGDNGNGAQPRRGGRASGPAAGPAKDVPYGRGVHTPSAVDRQRPFGFPAVGGPSHGYHSCPQQQQQQLGQLSDLASQGYTMGFAGQSSSLGGLGGVPLPPQQQQVGVFNFGGQTFLASPLAGAGGAAYTGPNSGVGSQPQLQQQQQSPSPPIIMHDSHFHSSGGAVPLPPLPPPPPTPPLPQPLTREQDLGRYRTQAALAASGRVSHPSTHGATVSTTATTAAATAVDYTSLLAMLTPSGVASPASDTVGAGPFAGGGNSTPNHAFMALPPQPQQWMSFTPAASPPLPPSAAMHTGMQVQPLPPPPPLPSQQQQQPVLFHHERVASQHDSPLFSASYGGNSSSSSSNQMVPSSLLHPPAGTDAITPASAGSGAMRGDCPAHRARTPVVADAMGRLTQILSAQSELTQVHRACQQLSGQRQQRRQILAQLLHPRESDNGNRTRGSESGASDVAVAVAAAVRALAETQAQLELHEGHAEAMQAYITEELNKLQREVSASFLPSVANTGSGAGASSSHPYPPQQQQHYPPSFRAPASSPNSGTAPAPVYLTLGNASAHPGVQNSQIPTFSIAPTGGGVQRAMHDTRSQPPQGQSMPPPPPPPYGAVDTATAQTAVWGATVMNPTDATGARHRPDLTELFSALYTTNDPANHSDPTALFSQLPSASHLQQQQTTSNSVPSYADTVNLGQLGPLPSTSAGVYSYTFQAPAQGSRSGSSMNVARSFSYQALSQQQQQQQQLPHQVTATQLLSLLSPSSTNVHV